MSKYRLKLKGQIRDSFGKLVYTYTSHLKEVDILKSKMKRLKRNKIILSSISSSGIFSTIFVDSIYVKIISSILSFLLFYFTSSINDLDFNHLVNQHTHASDYLRHVRDDYVSLLVDFNYIDIKKIIKTRDDLQRRASFIYDNSPKTSPKAYSLTQNALKHEEEQYFTDQEIDQMLIKVLRSNNK